MDRKMSIGPPTSSLSICSRIYSSVTPGKSCFGNEVSDNRLASLKLSPVLFEIIKSGSVMLTLRMSGLSPTETERGSLIPMSKIIELSSTLKN